jgi:hypothetical protein
MQISHVLCCFKIFRRPFELDLKLGALMRACYVVLQPGWPQSTIELCLTLRACLIDGLMNQSICLIDRQIIKKLNKNQYWTAKLYAYWLYTPPRAYYPLPQA